VLELDGKVVTESAVIMNLLEEAFPDNKPLMPPKGEISMMNVLVALKAASSVEGLEVNIQTLCKPEGNVPP
jgi:glutathione S-transferase